MKLAIIFNGQGAHYQNMGEDFCASFQQAADVIQEVEQITHYPIRKWINEDFDQLIKTQYAQPAIAAVGLSIYQSIAPLLPAVSYMAGLSLGEYTALIASEHLSVQEGFELLKARGQIMTKACEVLNDKTEVQMAAVLNMPLDEIRSIVESIQTDDSLYIANYNSNTQTVIGGSKSAIKRFTQIAKEKSYKKVIPLKVEGPFHTPLMQDAVEPYEEVLNETHFDSGLVDVISNLTVEAHNLETIRDYLAKHLIQPVRWQETIEFFIKQEVTHIIQIGPGKTLASLLKRQDQAPSVLVVDKVEDVAQIENFLEEGANK